MPVIEYVMIWCCNSGIVGNYQEGDEVSSEGYRCRGLAEEIAHPDPLIS